MDVVVGLDLGTTYLKCVVVSASGTVLGVDRLPLEPDRPQKGHVELPVARFVHSVRGVVDNALRQSERTADRINAISYSSQANTFALFDRSMTPLTPFILWTDERTSDGSLHDCKPYGELENYGISNRAMPAKLLWFRQNRPARWEQTAHILTISDYLLYSLTGIIAGDRSTASLTGMVDELTLRYKRERLAEWDLDGQMLPTLVAPGARVGEAAGELARQIGIQRDASVMAGNLDHVSAAVGAGIGVHAPASFSLGTVLAVLGISEDAGADKDIVSGPYPHPGSFFRLSFRDLGASTLEWYRKRYAPAKTFAQLGDEAATVPPGCDGLIALPHVAHNLGDTASVFSGVMTSGAESTDGYRVRAIMEMTAATLAELLEVVFGASLPQKLVATGGGARSDLWLRIIADMTGAVVSRAGIEEPAAYGAAIHAAVGARWYSTIENVVASWMAEVDVYAPDMGVRQTYIAWRQRYNALTRDPD